MQHRSMVTWLLLFRVSGLQHDTIHNRQAMGVPLEEKFLPQYLRQQGYKTHAIGKVSVSIWTDH